MHIDSIDLMIFIGGIIINSLCCVAAGSVESDLIFAFCYFAAATLLIYGAEDVEELADAFFLAVTGDRVCTGKRHTRKAGLGGEIPRKTESAHAAAVGGKRCIRREVVLRLARGERLVVVKLEHLLWEGWVIG